MRIEQLEDKVMEDYGIGTEDLVAEYGPELLVPPTPPAPGDDLPEVEPEPYPFVREEQEKRLKAAERDLALLGKVNPLALEEFSAMEERHRFLSEQLEDLRKSRADLMKVIADVDHRVQTVFAEAYADTEREFKDIFPRLFPGGEARMVLTNPEDLLAAGVEIEARPPGKTFKRLSLLSGGERSLTAIALLPGLVVPAELPRANARLELARAVVSLAAPLVAGTLAQALSPEVALPSTAVSAQELVNTEAAVPIAHARAKQLLRMPRAANADSMNRKAG